MLPNKDYPKNTEVFIAIPDFDKKSSEIYWQTKYANHLLENYTLRDLAYSGDHDLKFNDLPKLLKSAAVRKSNRAPGRYEAIAFNSTTKRYYLIIFSPQKRFDHQFFVIITVRATKDQNHVSFYEDTEAYKRWQAKGK